MLALNYEKTAPGHSEKYVTQYLKNAGLQMSE